MRTSLVFLISLSSLPVLSQVNDKGTFHVAIGASAGGHATEYIQTLTISGAPLRSVSNDGAATVLFPIDIQVGVAKPVSLGLFLEPGSYLDSNATRTNSLVLFGFQPRAYILNRERFCWMASLQIGSGTLNIDDTENGVSESARYAGQFFGLSSGVGFYFGEHVSLQLHLRYMGSTLLLKEYEENGNAVDLSAIEGKLTTTGGALQTSLAFRF